MCDFVIAIVITLALIAIFSQDGDFETTKPKRNMFISGSGETVPLPTEGTGGEMPLAPQPIATEPQETEATTKTIEELAYEVIRGLWGNGEERKRLLTEAGHDCKAVQQRVNEIMTELKRGRKNASKNHI